MRKSNFGFTIIELLVVIVIIGILASITFVAYGSIQAKVIDESVATDVLRMGSAQLKYKTDTGVSGKAYYSGSATDTSGLGFKPNSGNVIDVVTNSTGYCIRGYNIKGTKNSIYNPSIEESTPGICNQIAASAAAIADSPAAAPGKTWSSISAGRYNICGIASDNNAYCWGFNSDGQLGNNSTTQSGIPVAVNATGVLSGKTIKSISAGWAYTCAIASDNNAYCWGENDDGALGNNSTTPSLVPVAVDTTGVLSGKTIKSIATGEYHTCAIASDNNIYCWGRNSAGQLGNNSTTDSHVPVAVNTAGVLSGKTIKSISIGYAYSCAVASDNNAYCWGHNAYGQLGNNSMTNSSVPVAVVATGVLSGKTIKSLSSGEWYTCAIASDDKAYCWGDNSYGELGNNSTTQSSVPVAVTTTGVLSGKTVKAMSALVDSSCAIASDNQSYCWGYNGNGQLGNNSSVNSSVPVAVNTAGVLNGKTILNIAIGGPHACALASDNQAYCWGNDGFGELGDNTTNNSLVPVAAVHLP